MASFQGKHSKGQQGAVSQNAGTALPKTVSEGAVGSSWREGQRGSEERRLQTG